MSVAYRWVEPPWPQKVLPRAQLEDRIEQLLGSTNMCVVATTGKTGQPIASPIEYYADGLDVYMLPDPGTPKLKAMQRDPRVCVAIHGAYHGWHSARGMQIFRWHEWMSDLGMDARKPFERQVCRIVPDRILYTDTWLWKQGYKAKQEWKRATGVKARPARKQK
jgi:hypothetical protein